MTHQQCSVRPVNPLDERSERDRADPRGDGKRRRLGAEGESLGPNGEEFFGRDSDDEGDGDLFDDDWDRLFDGIIDEGESRGWRER